MKPMLSQVSATRAGKQRNSVTHCALCSIQVQKPNAQRPINLVSISVYRPNNL